MIRIILNTLSGVAGGLTNLSKMAACNVLLLGSQKKTLSGFSQASALPHTGFIYHSDIVQDMPPVSIFHSEILKLIKIRSLSEFFYVSLSVGRLSRICVSIQVFII